MLAGFYYQVVLLNTLHHHFYTTFALITGFVIGSIYAVFPGLPQTGIEWTLSIITLIIGFAASYWIGQITDDNV